VVSGQVIISFKPILPKRCGKFKFLLNRGMGDWMTKTIENGLQGDIEESQEDTCASGARCKSEFLADSSIVEPELQHQNDNRTSLTNMETDSRELPAELFLSTEEEDTLLVDDSVDIVDEDIGVGGSDIFSSAADPWLPLVPGTGVVESSDQSQEQDTSRVTEWLLQVEDSPLNSTTDTASMSPTPATTGEAIQSVASKKNQPNTGNKILKDQKLRKSMEMCQHGSKAASMSGIRKALKSDLKIICSAKPSCCFATIKSGSSTDTIPLVSSNLFCLLEQPI